MKGGPDLLRDWRGDVLRRRCTNSAARWSGTARVRRRVELAGRAQAGGGLEDLHSRVLRHTALTWGRAGVTLAELMAIPGPKDRRFSRPTKTKPSAPGCPCLSRGPAGSARRTTGWQRRAWMPSSSDLRSGCTCQWPYCWPRSPVPGLWRVPGRPGAGAGAAVPGVRRDAVQSSPPAAPALPGSPASARATSTFALV